MTWRIDDHQAQGQTLRTTLAGQVASGSTSRRNANNELTAYNIAGRQLQEDQWPVLAASIAVAAAGTGLVLWALATDDIDAEVHVQATGASATVRW